jgi:hypothetical protein
VLYTVGGQQVGNTLFREAVPVNNGLFMVALDFGPGVFIGEPRVLEVAVRTNNTTEPYVRLLPRQQITYVPYAFYANTASNLVGAISAAQLPDNVARLDARQTFTGAATFTHPSNRFAGTFTGNGGSLTNLSATQLGGVIADARLSTNVAFLNANQTFKGLVTFSPAAGAPFAVARTNVVTNLNADFLDGDHATDFVRVKDLPTIPNTNDFWQLRGNANTTPGTHFVGTTDNKALELKANNTRVLRLEPTGSLAAGPRASAANNGAFVWADSRSPAFSSTGQDQFRVRAVGGAEFVTSIDLQGAAVSSVKMTATNGLAVNSVSDTNAALELRQGYFKVTGAGTRAGAPVFIHRLTAANMVMDQAGRLASVINHPLCNSDPSAILFVNPCLNPGDSTGTNQVANWTAVGTLYTGTRNTAFTGANQNKWALYFINPSLVVTNAAFNVMVVKP